jgi:Flp pilus assembly protein TadG
VTWTVVRRRDDGQILALFAGGLFVLILVAGLVIDGGNLFLQRRDAQNAADIGSMAGTKRIADYHVHGSGFGSGNAFSHISDKMTDNGCTAATACTWTARYVGPRSGATFVDLGAVGAGDGAPPGNALGVKVDVTKLPRTYLLGVIGQTQWKIDTVATSIAGRIPGAPASQLLPLAVTEMPIEEGAVYALTSGATGPGNFGWLSWSGGGLAPSVCTPNNPAFSLPAEFNGDPGTSSSSAVRSCLQQWVTSKTPVLIPIVLKLNDPANTPGCATEQSGGTFSYCVVGLAAFVLTGVSTGSIDRIDGRFVGTIPYSVASDPNVPGTVNQPPEQDSTLYAIGLAQ